MRSSSHNQPVGKSATRDTATERVKRSVPAAMQRRCLLILTQIGAEQNSTMVSRMPIDIMKPFLSIIERADRAMSRPNGVEKASLPPEATIAN
jgi:hypothetical protein